MPEQIATPQKAAAHATSPVRQATGVGWRMALALSLLAFTVVMVRTAWLCDDSYITLRVVENCANGLGLRWNAADRVLINAHPLWLLLLSVLRPLTGEVYFTTIFTSMALSLLAVALLARSGLTASAATVAVTILLSSRAFADFTTGGLENPLAYLLLALFFGMLVRGTTGLHRLAGLSLIASLAFTTRHDLVLLIGPALIVPWWRQRGVAATAVVAAGMLPLIAWVAAASIYYGTPLPIVSHAKLFDPGVPVRDMLRQGFSYLMLHWGHDRITVVAIVAGSLVALLGRRCLVAGRVRPTAAMGADPGGNEDAPPWAALACGILLYLAYVVRIGGDFMLGRFMAAPLLVAVLVLTRCRWLGRSAPAMATVVVAIGAGLWSPRPTLGNGPDYRGQGLIAHGIADTRDVYYARFGLLSPRRAPPVPNALTDALRAAGRNTTDILIVHVAGWPSLTFGPAIHVVDMLLCDPLIGRLPTVERSGWRISHLKRHVPTGYLETLATGKNRIRHPGLAEYYDRLCLLTRADLTAPGRWRAIWDFALGRYDHLMRAYLRDEYFAPPPQRVALTALAATPERTPWYAEGNIGVYEGGVEVDLGGVQHAAEVAISLHSQGHYEVSFVRAGETLATATVLTRDVVRYGMQDYTLATPAAARDAGFDTLLVRNDFGKGADYVAAMGQVRLLPIR